MSAGRPHGRHTGPVEAIQSESGEFPGIVVASLQNLGQVGVVRSFPEGNTAD